MRRGFFAIRLNCPECHTRVEQPDAEEASHGRLRLCCPRCARKWNPLPLGHRIGARVFGVLAPIGLLALGVAGLWLLMHGIMGDVGMSSARRIIYGVAGSAMVPVYVVLQLRLLDLSRSDADRKATNPEAGK